MSHSKIISDNNNSKSLIAKNFYLQLLPSSQSSLINIEKGKDERLEHVEIAKGLIEILQSNGFSVEMILEYGPSQIAEILGIDVYIGEIIYKETKKITNNIHYDF